MRSFFILGKSILLSCILATCFFSGSSFSQSNPICTVDDSDLDGDGWGWENNQSCRVGDTPELSTPTESAASNSGSVCMLANSDSDNDGWGWENGQSCRVLPSDSQTTTADNSSNTCMLPDSDPDGDGWGWENNSSCRVGTATTPSAELADQSDTAPTELTDQSPPYCSPSITDGNNDGWGWENNQSCRIAHAEFLPMKIMAVGDSITQGISNQQSYRKPMNSLLDQAGCQYSLVGSQTTNRDATFHAAHESFSGHTADYFLTGFKNNSDNNLGISHSMATYDPDVILLHIGSNDMRKGQSVDSTLSEIDLIIAAIQQHNASAVVLLANVIPWYRAEQKQVELLGNQIEKYVDTLDNPLVRLVDVRTGYQPAMMVSDMVHPNSDGEAHIADAFFQVYSAASLCVTE